MEGGRLSAVAAGRSDLKCQAMNGGGDPERLTFTFYVYTNMCAHVPLDIGLFQCASSPLDDGIISSYLEMYVSCMPIITK